MITSQSSFIWKAIEKNMNLIYDYLQWQVGNGSSIDMSSKFWIAPLPRHTWDIPKICNLYPANEVNKIITLALSKLGHPDSLIWSQSANGNFTYKDGYKLLCHNEENNLHPRIRNMVYPWKYF